ncbi:DUF1499 domain-containing protein [Solidesulfovibrio sp.]|uniref:DUF1499 domain-containing protein n=1 Tax=Solidesulfovibrio sp. TaxID=2910990 RepID=UPI002613E253|nr:DUF1499 domain-containing protein [Solidesulfovibrio sp.]
MMETLRKILSFFEAVGQVAAVVLLVAVVVGVVWFAWLGWQSRRMPALVSPTGGPLRADGDKPNWVSSTARKADVLHHIAPRPAARNPIPALSDALPGLGLTVVDASERYLHATASSPRFGFVDDVEFLYDPAAGLLHARSASRVGYSDIGANRRRLEMIFKETGL